MKYEKDDEDILREKFKKENPESLDLFKKVVDNIFGDSGEDDDDYHPFYKE